MSPHRPSAPTAPLFPALPAGLGDYTLRHLLGSHGCSDFYIARQRHVERRVVLEILRPDAEGGNAQAAEFLSNARARAGVSAKLPHTAPVLESATSPEGYAYISQALPEGTPLAAMAALGEQLTVQQACSLIIAAGALYEACTNAGAAAGALAEDMVFMTRTGEFNFLSPVLNALPAEGDTAVQMQGLAATISSVQPMNVPGQTRLATLLSWMQDGYEGELLEWEAVTNTAALIIEQLKPEALLQVTSPEHFDAERERRASKRRRRRQRRKVQLIALALATVIAMGGAGTLLTPEDIPPIPALRDGCVHARVDGKQVRIAAAPVSIGEYNSFLEAFPGLDTARRGSLTQGIPPTESDPTPADWAAQLKAAKQGAEWQGRRLSMDAPVTNVTYWQALMYARYRRSVLPGAALLATARREAGQPGIEEWTKDELPPSTPYTKAYLVLPARDNASPIPESSPTAHSPQRGFRICL